MHLTYKKCNDFFYIFIDCYLGQKEKMAAIENTVEIEIEMEIEIEIEMYKKA